jgi:membrane protein DedA with SNARE-associated domain/membrane-associated phospholipid phosphatase
VLDYLIRLVGRLGHWGYLVVFLVSALECSAFLGLLVPGESLVLVAGFFAAQGVLDVGDLIVLVALGATIGDSIGYELGSRLGRPWFLRYGGKAGLRASHLEDTEAFFTRHGGKAVFLGRFIGFARALVPFIAGSSRMRYRDFLPYNALGGVLWATGFVLLGYFLGEGWRTAERWIGRASAIVGGLILLLFLLGWTWRWLVRREDELKKRFANLIAHPRTAVLRRRFAPQIEFVRARLSPEGYLGLHLTAGALFLIGASWLFGAIAEDVLSGDPLTVVDLHVAAWLHTHATAGLTTAMVFVSRLGSAPVVVGVIVLMALFLSWSRLWYWLLALSLVVPGGVVLNILLKHAFHRPRPVWDNPLQSMAGYSFPSGHTMAATVLYGFLGTYLVWTFPPWCWRVSAVLVAFSLVALIGFSRIYLGVHYLSDVLAAIVEGIAWLALCLTAVFAWKRRRSELLRVGEGS